MDTSRPCHCGGENQNCYDCDGTGYIQPYAARNIFSLPSVPNTGALPLRQQRRRNPKPMLAQQLLRATPPTEENSSGNYSHILCPNCEQLIPHSRALNHKAECLRFLTIKASYKPEQPATVLALPPTLRATSITECKVCGCHLNAKNLRRHLAKVHKIQTDVPPFRSANPVKHRLPVKGAVVKAKIHERTRPEKDTVLDDHNERDASKYIGHFAREHGRFGSMPMYDDYGDEGSSE